VWVVIVLAGCVADPPADMPLQIVVWPGGAQLFTGGADLAPCMCDVPIFPRIGECVHETDEVVCHLPEAGATCESCLTSWGLDGNDFVIAGCGRPETRIPLGDAPFPMPTVSASFVDGAPTVTWMTDIVAASAQVMISGIYDADRCHIQGAISHTFAPHYPPTSAYVQTFAPPIELDSSFGPVTIWRGGFGYAQFPTP
jgi:hypothetical protein